MRPERVFDVIESWKSDSFTVHSLDEILDWISEQNKSAHVSINKCSIFSSDFWFYDDYSGEILNRKRSFFSIKGVRLFINDSFVKEQPMIIQPEIGYLGIIARKINGVLHFLMQAKIEPGNVNCVQISPTIQATKSNFMRTHGGSLPAYFELFEHSDRYEILYDQIQSEQGSRFLSKRNRNIIIIVDDDFEVLPNFIWMTLGQIKQLMKQDNLVNMDTRTVLSGISFVTGKAGDTDREKIMDLMGEPNRPLFRSMFDSYISDTLQPALHYLNDYKMFNGIHRSNIPLFELIDWKVDEYGIRCEKPGHFEVSFYDIEISGREVAHWTQPLVVASESALFVLLIRNYNGVMQFLVKACPEIGSFDKIELGPSIQLEASECKGNRDSVAQLYERIIENEDAYVLVDVLLSEEGGRFYHEQNRNRIIEIRPEELNSPPEGYFWLDYSALNYLIQSNNYVNIQLRTLLSLLPLS